MERPDKLELEAMRKIGIRAKRKVERFSGYENKMKHQEAMRTNGKIKKL